MIARVRGSAADAVIGAGGGRGALEAVVAGLANVDRLAAVAARADELADALGLGVLVEVAIAARGVFACVSRVDCRV